MEPIPTKDIALAVLAGSAALASLSLFGFMVMKVVTEGEPRVRVDGAFRDLVPNVLRLGQAKSACFFAMNWGTFLRKLIALGRFREHFGRKRYGMFVALSIGWINLRQCGQESLASPSADRAGG